MAGGRCSGWGSGLALTVETHGFRTIRNSSPDSPDPPDLADQVSATAGRTLPNTRAEGSGCCELEQTPSNDDALTCYGNVMVRFDGMTAGRHGIMI